MMTRTFALLVCAWLSACAIAERPESASEPQASGVAVPERSVTQRPASDLAAPTAPETAEAATAEDKRFSQEEIRAMQARLRRAGFDPGPADGIFGARTKAALARLESACVDLADLLISPAADPLQKSPAAGRPAAAGVSSAASTADSIRLLQVRLKEAGFDPGALDGIAGAKTKAALARLEADCASRP
jgi:peptidoglycan hydrolase-like protein with peptidoglycan-binding domain